MTGRIDPQHVSAEGAKKAGADGTGNDSGQVEDPKSLRRKVTSPDPSPRTAVATHLVADERFTRHGPLLGVDAPLGCVPDRRRDASGRKDSLFYDCPGKGPDGETDFRRVVRSPQRVEKGSFVPRVVGVTTEPAVGGRPKSRQGREPRPSGPTIQLKIPFASNGRASLSPVDADCGHSLVLVPQGRSRQQRHRHTRDGCLLDRQVGRQLTGRTADHHPGPR